MEKQKDEFRSFFPDGVPAPAQGKGAGRTDRPGWLVVGPLDAIDRRALEVIEEWDRERQSAREALRVRYPGPIAAPGPDRAPGGQP